MKRFEGPRRTVGRPRDPAKTEAVLDAAWSLFLDKGVEAVPIEAIAARAGVSKSTLYASYADKAALFEAAVLREMERIEAAQQPADIVRTATLPEALRAFGIGIMSFLASEPAVSFYNALSAELRRQPELANAFWKLGPGRTRANLTAILASAKTKGEIEIASAEQAADLLFGMWQGFTNMQLALGIASAEVEESVAARVQYGVDVFMLAFAVER